MAVISQLNAKDLKMSEIAEVFGLDFSSKQFWVLKEESMVDVPGSLRKFHYLALSRCNTD